MFSFPQIRDQLRQLWAASAPMTAAAILMLAAFVASLAGIVLDHRTTTGVPAWLKPAKFAISTAIYLGTVAWLFRYIKVWPRLMAAIGWVLAIVLVLEVGIIDIQAARGTTSHFNVGTGLDRALFGIMGAAIGILWLASIVVLIALFRQYFADGAWGWALRLGMLVTVLGSASGGLMLQRTDQQIEAARLHRPVVASGGHTVGAADGGPGLPGLGWSTQHGDLRIPHFFGLHGVQIVPLLAWMVSRRRWQFRFSNIRLVFTVACGYLTFAGILTWQALRGQSIVQPDAATLIAFGIWAVLVVAMLAGSRKTEQVRSASAHA